MKGHQFSEGWPQIPSSVLIIQSPQDTDMRVIRVMEREKCWMRFLLQCLTVELSACVLSVAAGLSVDLPTTAGSPAQAQAQALLSSSPPAAASHPTEIPSNSLLPPLDFKLHEDKLNY